MTHSRTAIMLISCGIIIIGVLCLYHTFDPTHSIYAPKCIIKSITGNACPGCGCQRLLYNWANGRFIEGLRFNYFFPIGILYIILILIGKRLPKLQRFCSSAATIYLFIALYIAWWILRNILGI